MRAGAADEKSTTAGEKGAETGETPVAASGEKDAVAGETLTAREKFAALGEKSTAADAGRSVRVAGDGRSARASAEKGARARGGADKRLTRGIVCAIVGGACWGFSGNCASFLFESYGTDARWLMCIRLLTAGALFLVFSLATGRERLFSLWRDRGAMLRTLAFAVCGFLFNMYFYLQAINYTNAGTATVLMCLQLILIMGYSCVCSRRAPKRREAVGIVLAIGGTFLIATGGNPAALSIPPLGLFFGLGSALGGALLNIVPARILPRYGAPAVNGTAMIAAGVVLSAFVHPWSMQVELPAMGWVVVAALVVVGSFLAFLLYMQGVSDIGSVRASMLGTSEPIAATLISVLWMGVAFAPTDLVGFGCIIAMIFLVV